MNYPYPSCRWCGWCCNYRPVLCCCCNLCPECCRCPPPRVPAVCPIPRLPPMPCMGPAPPPVRIVHEHVMLPCPFPVCAEIPCQPNPPKSTCEPCDFYCDGPCREAAGYSLRLRNRHRCRPRPYVKEEPFWPRCRYRRIYKPGRAIVPGYTGHVPGFKIHGGARTFGHATQDTCCIISKWKDCDPDLPCRIFEQ